MTGSNPALSDMSDSRTPYVGQRKSLILRVCPTCPTCPTQIRACRRTWSPERPAGAGGRKFHATCFFMSDMSDSRTEHKNIRVSNALRASVAVRHGIFHVGHVGQVRPAAGIAR